MTLISTAAQNKSLANDYGASKGPNAASAHKVRLYVGDPAAGGSELASTGGYTPPVLSNDGTGWPSTPSAGAITSAPVTFATSTAAWASVPTHFLLEDNTTGDAWDSGPLANEIVVDQAGTVVTATLTVFYNSSF